MKISVVLCSYGRPVVLDQTVESVLNQTVKPDEILIVCPTPEHVQERTLDRERVRFITSRRGLTFQRNTALDNFGDTDLVAFLDDDIELCPSYLESMVYLFQGDPEVIVASGHMLADGGRGVQVSRATAKQLCASAEIELANHPSVTTTPLDYGYGCNLMVRASSARTTRFDENLSLYGWLEDSDFSYHCTRGKKPPLTNLSAQCVHLGWRGSRISGRKMGFSIRHIVIQYWMRWLVANCVGVLWGKPEDDRLNRLKGNVTAMWHLLNGRCDPMAINQLQ
jgi:glycosyltransferase involved in cell wall biosynthesis